MKSNTNLKTAITVVESVSSKKVSPAFVTSIYYIASIAAVSSGLRLKEIPMFSEKQPTTKPL